jgi:hypothetical protein
MKKKLLVLLTLITIVSAVPLSAYAYDGHYDSHWKSQHERMWNDHRGSWEQRDREWRAHRNDRHWREEHARLWHNWYQWHQDNAKANHIHVSIGNLDIDM